MLTKKQMKGIQLVFGIKLINIQLHVVKIKKGNIIPETSLMLKHISPYTEAIYQCF
jgi:hypothetical protein